MLSSTPPSLNVALREVGFTFFGFFMLSSTPPSLNGALREVGVTFFGNSLGLGLPGSAQRRPAHWRRQLALGANELLIRWLRAHELMTGSERSIRKPHERPQKLHIDDPTVCY